MFGFNLFLTCYLLWTFNSNNVCYAVNDYYYTMFENTVIKGMDPVLETNTTSVLECQLLSQHPTRFMINVLKVFDHWYHCRIFMNKKSPKMDKEYFQDHTNSTVYILDKPKPKDCQDWKTLGYDKDGLYDIVIDRKSVQVWCDMTNFDGGWIVFQKRFNNSVDFNRDWEEYKDGFGQINGGEFWLGNEHLHRLTWGKSVQFIFEVEDTDGVTRYGRHDSFFISSEDDFYRMSSDMRVMDGMGGFGLVKGQPFSTTGSDHDSWPYGNCADRFQGGWWYNDCGTAFFNGINDPSVEFYGIRFTAWNNLKDKVRTKMMIKVA